jgi:K+-sensing histidine kinase KdpD
MLIAAPCRATLLIASCVARRCRCCKSKVSSRRNPALPTASGQHGSSPPVWGVTALSCSSIRVLLRKRSTRGRREQAMARIRWRAVVQCSAGSLALELLTFVCLRLRLDVATAVCISLIIVVLWLRASLLVWAVGSFIAVGRLAFFFAPQILSFRVNDPTEAAAILAFLTTPVVPTKVEAHE